MQSSGPPCDVPDPPRLLARRKQVTDAARHLFAECGFENTRMIEISVEAGIKMGQIYRDFDGKQAIVVDIVCANLEQFLDEAALESAITSGEPIAVRRWITDFLRRGCEPARGRLLAQIVIEAARNRRIAELFQDGDRRIADCLERALAAIAPASPAQDRVYIINVVMALMIGPPQRQVVVPDENLTAMTEGFVALLERELDLLLAG